MMEQVEAHKRLTSILKRLELGEPSSDAGAYSEKMKLKAIQKVEADFEECISALKARKQLLVEELDSKYQEEDNKHNSRKVIDAIRRVLQSGSKLYQTNRDVSLELWKNAANLQPSKMSLFSVEFQPLLESSITSHCSVVKHAPYSSADTVTTLVGSTPEGLYEGSGLSAKFNAPTTGCLNPADGCLYVSDFNNNVIRKVTNKGDATTFAGKNGETILKPCGIVAYAKEDCFFVCSREQRLIKKITFAGRNNNGFDDFYFFAGTVSTFAGSGQTGRGDGVGASASFNSPQGLAIDESTGNLFVTDISQHLIRKISPQGEVSTLAGTGTSGLVDGIGTSAAFNSPDGVCFDAGDNSLVICDKQNNKLRKLLLDSGEVKTLCDITAPMSVVLLPNRSFLVSTSHKLFSVVQKGEKYEVNPLAGEGTKGFEEGASLSCKFNTPTGILFDATTDTCFVFDQGNHRIRKFTLL